ncbi:MAG: A24 family peptidase C-terminal domain-containing protein [Candidatus Thermoplasmatota archaeon]|nr:A24 family peptidase C-terminal domain-containing protein [Candidatus Thermoplasmatota archaeon]
MSSIEVQLELIQWVRVSVLTICFCGAAWLDYKTRRVSNDWWWGWAKPALFLLTLELLILDAGWMIWLTASAVVAFASTALIGVPDIDDIRKGSVVDIVVTIWYFASGVGLVMGTMEYTPILMDYFDPSIVMDTNSSSTKAALLWGQIILMGIVLLFFEMAWRFRMLHGGADAKAMMLATLLLPSWNGAAFPLCVAGSAISTSMPPALSLLIWAGLAFLVLPPLMLIRNASSGDFLPLSMSWHASKMALAEIPNNHVWLLEEVTDKPDGTRGVVRRMRPIRGSRAETDVEQVLKELSEEGIERAWVTAKHPFLLFVFPAILPLVLLGDPIVWVISYL